MLDLKRIWEILKIPICNELDKEFTRIEKKRQQEIESFKITMGSLKLRLEALESQMVLSLRNSDLVIKIYDRALKELEAKINSLEKSGHMDEVKKKNAEILKIQTQRDLLVSTRKRVYSEIGAGALRKFEVYCKHIKSLDDSIQEHLFSSSSYMIPSECDGFWGAEIEFLEGEDYIVIKDGYVHLGSQGKKVWSDLHDKEVDDEI